MKTQPLMDAVTTFDPFAQELVGLRVTDGNERAGRITAHECYDTDDRLCVERITVQWDDGKSERYGKDVISGLTSIVEE